MTDIFDEVNEDLRAERARTLLSRYGGALIGLAVLAVVATGGWQVWRWQQGKQADAVASTYFGGMKLADAPAGQTDAHARAMEVFGQVANSPDAGYRTLARLRDAALRADAGDAAGALRLWDQVTGDAGADPLLRDLASLLWAEHQVDGGDPAAVAARLKPLSGPDNAWHGLAQEAQAMLDLRTGHADQARDVLRQLAADAGTPDGVRGRANMLLAGMGG